MIYTKFYVKYDNITKVLVKPGVQPITDTVYTSKRYKYQKVECQVYTSGAYNWNFYNVFYVFTFTIRIIIVC